MRHSGALTTTFSLLLVGGLAAQILSGNVGGASLDRAEDVASLCSEGLAQAGRGRAAVERAQDSWAVLAGAAHAYGIPTRMLAAIGVRESGFADVSQTSGGVGYGVFQIPAWSAISDKEAGDLPWAAAFTSRVLAEDQSQVKFRFPWFSAGQTLQATARVYNFGLGDWTQNLRGLPSASDKGTTGNDYGSDVQELMSCFE